MQKWLALYRIEKVLTDSNYLIRKVGTNLTQIIHRIRMRPINSQYHVDDIPRINLQNRPTIGKKQRRAALLWQRSPGITGEWETQLHTTVPKNFDSPVRISISFGTTAQPPTLPATPPAPPIAAPAIAVQPQVPSRNIEAAPIVHPRRILTPPDHLTARIPDSCEDSDEYVEPTQPLGRSERLQEQNQNKYQVFETARTQLRKTQTSKRTSQGETKEAGNFVDLLNNRRKERQQIQLVQRTGSQQSGSNTKKQRPNMNETQQDTTQNIRIVKEDINRKKCNVGHCVSSDFLMGAGIASKFN